MNDIELKFIVSHIKKAIWNLECANNLKSGSVDTRLIEQLKIDLIYLKTRGDEYGTEAKSALD